MTILHVIGPECTGGAAVAAQSVVDCVGGEAYRIPPPTQLQEAIRCIGGYCDPRVVQEVRKVLRRVGPTAVHLHDFKRAGTGWIKACKDEGVQVVASIYDYWCLCPRDTGYGCCELRPDRPCCRTWHPVNRRPVLLLAKLPLVGRRRRIMRWMNQLDAVICLSRHSERLLRQHGLTVPVHVVPLPITVPEIKAERNPNVVLYLGGERPHKGAAVLREAMRIVQEKRPDVIAKAVNTPDRAVALREIASAACLVVPELWPNPGPVVIAEAQLLGTPVVASDIGGIPEMGPTLLCSPGNTPDLADKIAFLLRMTGHPIIMASPSGSYETEPALRRHDSARVRALLEEAYDSVCNNPGRSGKRAVAPVVRVASSMPRLRAV